MKLLITIASAISLVFCFGAMAFLANGQNNLAFGLLIICFVIMIINMFLSRGLRRRK